MRDKTDVFVIGGGPAGLAAAIAARLQGFDVTLADSALPSIDKACGEGLMPDSFSALQRLGLHPNPQRSFPLRGVKFIGAAAKVDAPFPDRAGIGIRRTELHSLLLQRAQEIGVRLLWGTRVDALDTIRCRWLIGADGQHSHVRRWARLGATRRESSRFGFRRHWEIAPWSDRIEIYWGNGCQVYVTPVSPSEVCVALLCRDRRLRLDQALRQFPEIQERLASAEPSSTERGAITPMRQLRRVYNGSTILIGDAAGSVDAISGDGVTLALHQAVALGDALATENLDHYSTEHRRLERRPALMARLMLWLDRSDWLRDHTLQAMANQPAIFSKLVAMHVGSLSDADFLLHGMLPLARRLIFPGRLSDAQFVHSLQRGPANAADQSRTVATD